MRELKIAVANTRKAKTWNNRVTTWEAFIERLSTTQKTIETIEEFLAMKRGEQDEIKDVGGYVMGHLKQGKRRAGSVLCRSCVTLDMDFATPGIMEHVERAGIHSGDSISVYPAQTLSQVAKDRIIDYTEKLAKALHVRGMINIQFIDQNDEIYCIEVNPRSSRTVPYISKVTGIPIVSLATRAILGHKITEMGYKPGLQPEAGYVAIKMPVFSFEKIRDADISLGPEMKSTGEALGISKSWSEALYKAFLGAGVDLPKYRNMIITVRDEDKEAIVPIAARFERLGYRIYSTYGTAAYLNAHGVHAVRTNKLEQPHPNLMDLILGHRIDLIIDLPPHGIEHQHDGFVIRRNAIETGVNVLTAIDTAEALVTSLESTDKDSLTLVNIADI